MSDYMNNWQTNINKQWLQAGKVIERIEQAGFEAVFVGGAVRDEVMHRPSHDIDIATSALPNEVKQLFARTIDVGIAHGTVLVLDMGEPVEVTTYRTDGEYSDCRRPDEVTFVRSLAEDLQRRDFTMNALAMKLDGQLIDLFDGVRDIEQKVIRAVGEPTMRFSEDALRMLRAVRFSAQLDFQIEEATLCAIQEQAHLIDQIAVERVAAELEKIWVSRYPFKGVQMLVQTNLASRLAGSFERDVEKWRAFQASEANVGWAYLAFLAQEVSVISAYKLSNDAKRLAMDVLSVFKQLQQPVQLMQLFSWKEEVLLLVCQFAKWADVTLLHVERLLEQKRAFPIRTMSELVVTGTDLMQWTGKKGGPWLKEALSRIVEAVVTGEVKNEKQQIKEWFVHGNDER